MAQSGILRQYYTQGAGLDTIIKSYNPDIALFSTYIEWSIKSQDVVYNKSTITWAYKLETYDLSKWQAAKLNFGTAQSLLIGVTNNSSLNDVYVSIGGTAQYSNTSSNISVTSNKITTLASGEVTLTHNSDGTLSPAFSTYIRVKDFYNASGEASINDGQLNSQCSASGNLALDPIARHAVLYSAPEHFTDEDTVSIEYAVPSGMTGYIYLSLDGNATTETTTLKAVTGAGTYNYSFSANDQAKLWTIQDQGVLTKAVKFYIKSTASNGTVFREHAGQSTLEIINYMPTLSMEIYDTNTDVINRLTGNKYILVRHVSDAYFKTGGKANKGATVSSQLVKNSGVPLYGATGTFEKVQGTDTHTSFDFTVVDNYGRAVQDSLHFDAASGSYVPYVKLTCSSEVTPMTADGDVAVTLTGKYYQGSFGLKTNKMRMHYEVAKNNGEPTTVDMGYIYPTITGSDYTYTFTISGLEYLSVYDLIVRVSDEVSVEPAESHTVLAAVPIFDWSRTDFNFNVPVNIEGDLTVTGNITAGGNTVPTIVAQGKSGIWTYRTWSDGTAECWGKKDVSVTFPTSANWGGLFTTSAISASNVNFPFGLFAEIPVVNASLLIRSAGGILMAPGGAGSNIANMDQTGVYEIARGSYVSGSQAYTINYDVKGRWK
jgi:hypothetical protein